jgi:hypothetical protein
MYAIRLLLPCACLLASLRHGRQPRHRQAFSDSAERGLVRGANFYHDDLGIALTAPAGWKVQNAPEAIARHRPLPRSAVRGRCVPEAVYEISGNYSGEIEGARRCIEGYKPLTVPE